MARFLETEAAVLARLRALKARPDMSFNLLDIGVPLTDAGFAQEEIMDVMFAFEQELLIAFAPGNRVLILRALPEA